MMLNSINGNHHHDCGCWMCEEDREDRGEETAFAREQRSKHWHLEQAMQNPEEDD